MTDLELRDERIAGLQQEVAKLGELLHGLREENQRLRDEVARLKGQKGKPAIGPSRLNKGEKGEGKHGGGKLRRERTPDRTEIIKAQNIPEGSVFKGYADYTVQELVIKTETILYKAEKWMTPGGKLIIAKVPSTAAHSHFGPVLRSFILYQYYHALVTEPLILEELHEWGVAISSGHLHRLITEGKEQFHAEKEAILRTGLRVSRHIHVDDTGARHQGQNGYCTHIGNEWFAWFESTDNKSRINFLELLRAGALDYVLCGEALEYMAGQKMPQAVLKKLAEVGDRTFSDARSWAESLRRWNITDKRQVRIATEGALLGSVIVHGLNRNLAIVSDDAGQFNILCHALCWIHAERVLAKLIGFSDAQRTALAEVRTIVWELYRDIKAYKAEPREGTKGILEKRFDELCLTKTCFMSLNLALKRMARNKRELLQVLGRPDLPLHNNLSEGDIREYVKRRKISGGTRSDEGRRSRDTFASLKKTCRKLGVSFWQYLTDRICGEEQVPALSRLIEARAQSA